MGKRTDIGRVTVAKSRGQEYSGGELEVGLLKKKIVMGGIGEKRKKKMPCFFEVIKYSRQ